MLCNVLSFHLNKVNVLHVGRVGCACHPVADSGYLFWLTYALCAVLPLYYKDKLVLQSESHYKSCVRNQNWSALPLAIV